MLSDRARLSDVFLSVTGIILLRCLVESLLAEKCLHALSVLHFIAFYLSVYSVFIFLYMLFTGESLSQSLLNLKWAYPVILIAPVADFVIFDNNLNKMAYLHPGIHKNLITRFLSFGGEAGEYGITGGLKFEVAILLVLTGFHLRKKMNFMKTVAGVTGVYSVIYLYSLSPFFVKIIHDFFHNRYYYNDSVMICFHLMIFSFSVFLIYLKQNSARKETWNDSFLFSFFICFLTVYIYLMQRKPDFQMICSTVILFPSVFFCQQSIILKRKEEIMIQILFTVVSGIISGAPAALIYAAIPVSAGIIGIFPASGFYLLLGHISLTKSLSGMPVSLFVAIPFGSWLFYRKSFYFKGDFKIIAVLISVLALTLPLLSLETDKLSAKDEKHSISMFEINQKYRKGIEYLEQLFIHNGVFSEKNDLSGRMLDTVCVLNFIKNSANGVAYNYKTAAEKYVTENISELKGSADFSNQLLAAAYADYKNDIRTLSEFEYRFSEEWSDDYVLSLLLRNGVKITDEQKIKLLKSRKNFFSKLALFSLDSRQFSEEEIAQVKQYLKSLQHGDGGFYYNRKTGEISPEFLTAVSLRIIMKSENSLSDESVRSGIRFLIESQNEGGFWFGNKMFADNACEHVITTILVLQTLEEFSDKDI